MNSLLFMIQKLMKNSQKLMKGWCYMKSMYTSQNNDIIHKANTASVRGKSFSLLFLLTVCRPALQSLTSQPELQQMSTPTVTPMRKLQPLVSVKRDYFRRESDPPTMDAQVRKIHGSLVMLTFTSLKKQHDGACYILLPAPKQA